ncbi:NADH dehydrogenase [ubiquinone] iron-sulfur protein 5 [Pelodiscus sinensis]|uniref:NADH dehydrogenase [ubiquinone] iron-sulfur protein 5 n=1 Tax=Pelodiscus sinensis TaxID=13735 RepID=K7FC09_PELSI|nr:NADH dehydrogenase [ubiquinone] iron-sulfur protein 5 [Pelodiscus sinensis]|eukprot:XP_006117578.1 NADH dehydrogenase [ubiquinone] iron-sulfur protein 5 [Pelodiscus sinensis]
MPFWDLQAKLGIDADKWMLHQSSEQPHKRPSSCHAFEKEWIECADGIGQIRANRECKPELEDLHECINRFKMIMRLKTIVAQKKKLMKEGKYTPPEYHSGKEEARP